MSGQQPEPWCGPDNCPASICNGPHVEVTGKDGEVWIVPGPTAPGGSRFQFERGSVTVDWSRLMPLDEHPSAGDADRMDSFTWGERREVPGVSRPAAAVVSDDDDGPAPGAPPTSST